MVLLSRVLRIAFKRGGDIFPTITGIPQTKWSRQKWYFDLSVYNKYGLYHDDILDTDFIPEFGEALRRLPADIYDAMMYRSIRASQLELEKDFLPESQWTTYEEDITKGRYLQPYIEEVKREMQEKYEWEKAHSI